MELREGDMVSIGRGHPATWVVDRADDEAVVLMRPRSDGRTDIRRFEGASRGALHKE